jgi:hypothetical protein
VEEIKAEKWLTMEREERRTEGSPARWLLTGGSLGTDGRVTQIFRKEKMRSNNPNDGNYLLLRGILSKLMSSNVL